MARTAQEIQADLDQVERKRRRGVRKASDGQGMMEYDLRHLDKIKAELEAELAAVVPEMPVRARRVLINSCKGL